MLPDPNNDIVIKHYNYVILLAKFYIYKSKQTKKDLCVYTILWELEKSLVIKIKATESKKQNYKV